MCSSYYDNNANSATDNYMHLIEQAFVGLDHNPINCLKQDLLVKSNSSVYCIKINIDNTLIQLTFNGITKKILTSGMYFDFYSIALDIRHWFNLLSDPIYYSESRFDILSYLNKSLDNTKYQNTLDGDILTITNTFTNEVVKLVVVQDFTGYELTTVNTPSSTYGIGYQVLSSEVKINIIPWINSLFI